MRVLYLEFMTLDLGMLRLGSSFTKPHSINMTKGTKYAFHYFLMIKQIYKFKSSLKHKHIEHHGR